MLKKPLLLLSLTAALALTAAPALAQSVPQAPTLSVSGAAPTAEQAQKLAERLLLSSFGSGSQAEVTYGLPAALPLKLSAPFEVAATVRGKYSGNSTTFYRVFASAPLSASAVRDALQAQLTAQGWKVQQSGQPFGFEGNFQANYLNLYREGDTPFAFNASISGVGNSSNVEMVLNPIGQAQLAQLKKQPSYVPRSSLPLLRAFPGSKSKVSYPATGPGGSISTVWVQTDRSAGEVFNHYSAQLRAAGWKALTDTTTGPLRAVTYGLKDLNGREALGTLGIRSWEKDGGYVLTVSVQGFKP